MFKVVKDYSGNMRVYDVYAVRKNDNGITEFLLYINGEWVWKESESYRPAQF